MKKGRFESSASAKKHTKKVVAMLLVMLLLVGSVIGTTFAWLTAKTQTITNTFTVGSIDLHLTETDTVDNAKTFTLIPGQSIDKDPTVTVGDGSEKCYLFVRIAESNNTLDGGEKIVNYTPADGWDQLVVNENPVAGVFYRVQNAIEAGQSDAVYSVFENDKVAISDDLTKEYNKTPILAITAYAVQFDGFADVANAWAVAGALG